MKLRFRPRYNSGQPAMTSETRPRLLGLIEIVNETPFPCFGTFNLRVIRLCGFIVHRRYT